MTLNNSLTPSIQKNYKDFTLISIEPPEILGYYTFQARSISSNQIHDIRSLNLDSVFSRRNYNKAATLFLQETLRLCSINPESIILETLEFHERRICYATKPMNSIHLRKSNSEGLELNTKELLRNILTDVKQLSNKGEQSVPISSSRIFQIESPKSSHSYFLQDWNLITKMNTFQSRLLPDATISIGASNKEEEHVYDLALSILELHGEKIDDIRSLRKHSPTLYDSFVMVVLNKQGFKHHHFTPKVKNLLLQMLNRDPKKRPKIEDILEELTEYEQSQLSSLVFDQEAGRSSIISTNQDNPSSMTSLDNPTVNSINQEEVKENGPQTSEARKKRKFLFTSKPDERLTLPVPNNQPIHPKVKELIPLNVEEVNLWGSKIGDSGLTALSKSDSWANLTSLVLHGNDIGDVGIAFLSKSQAWTNLTILNLSNNAIGDSGTKELCKNKTWKNLSKLNLGNNSIGPEGAAALSKNNSWLKLTVLDLGNNSIGAKGAAALSKNSSWRYLVTLNIGHNSIGEEGVTALSKNSSWVNLATLNLDQNSIGVGGAKALSQNKSWLNLTTLYLEKNSIGSDGAAALSKNKTWRNLKALDLEKNSIGAGGAKALCENSSWVELMMVDLRYNSIDAEVAAAFKKKRPNIILNF